MKIKARSEYSEQSAKLGNYDAIKDLRYYYGKYVEQNIKGGPPPGAPRDGN